MADQNQSNKKGMNTFADDIDRSPLLTELERIGATVSRKGVQRAQLEDRIREEGKLLNQLLEQGRTTPQFTSSPFYQEQTQGLRESIRGLRTKMNTLDTTARGRAETEASNYIARQFGSTAINAQAAVMQKEASTQNRAFSMSGQSFDELEARRQDVLSSIRVRERTVQNEVKGVFTGRGQVDPEKSAAIGVMAGGLQGELKELATINAAQAIQRSSGRDPNSKIKSLTEMGEVANKILSAESIAQEVKAGGVDIMRGGKMSTVANEDVNKEIINQARQLSQALKELNEGVGKTDEELAKLRTTADESAANLDKLQKAQATSGGPGWGKTVTTLNNISQGFGIAGQAAQSLMIDQRMGQLSNTMGFANLANNRYNTYRQARAGDVASQYSLLDEGDTENFSTEMRKASNIVNGIYGVGSVAQTAAGGVQTAATLNPVENLISTSEVQNVRQQGLLQVGAGIAGTAIRIGDTARQVTANQNQIAAQNLGLEAKKALRYVSTEQAQGLRNYHVGLGVAGMGMGENASSFIQEAGSDAMLDKLIQARLSPEQFTEMAQVGVAGMGSAFKSDNVIASRNLERAGFGSMANNMQRMTTLASAGSNNPQENLANILEVAVGNGLNSSKALDMIVQNTAATASGVAQASGLDTTSAGAALIAGTVNKDLAAKNDIFAAERAGTVQQTLSRLANDTSVSYSGMLNTSNISDKTGLSVTDAAFAGDIDIATLKAMRSDKNAGQKLLNMGVDWQKSNMKNPQELIDKLMDTKLSAALVGAGALELDTTGGKMTDSIARKIKSGEKLSPDEQQLAGKLGMSDSKNIGGEEYISGLKSWYSEPNKSDKIDKAIKGEAPASAQTIADDLRTSGFKQASEAAKQAATELGGFTKAIQTFVALQSTFEKSGQKNEAEYSVMGEKMAKDFSVSTGMFKDGAKEFSAAVKRFSELSGIKSNAQPLMHEAITDLQKRIGGK